MTTLISEYARLEEVGIENIDFNVLTKKHFEFEDLVSFNFQSIILIFLVTRWNL